MHQVSPPCRYRSGYLKGLPGSLSLYGLDRRPRCTIVAIPADASPLDASPSYACLARFFWLCSRGIPQSARAGSPAEPQLRRSASHRRDRRALPNRNRRQGTRRLRLRPRKPAMMQILKSRAWSSAITTRTPACRAMSRRSLGPPERQMGPHRRGPH